MSAFVFSKLKIASQIGSTPTLIFGSDHGCAILSILLCNTTAEEALVTLYILREEETIPVSAELYMNVKIAAFETVELIKETDLRTEAGDTIHASSAFSGSLFNSFVSYREFTEL